MAEGIRLLKQSKKEKGSKRDSTSLKKVRDFMARYSDETNESQLFGPERESSHVRKVLGKSLTSLNSELELRDAPFVAGQGEAFKILDDEESDFQEQTAEDDAVHGEDAEAFKLADNESLRPLDEHGLKTSSNKESDTVYLAASDKTALESQEWEHNCSEVEILPSAVGESNIGDTCEASVNIESCQEGGGQQSRQESDGLSSTSVLQGESSQPLSSADKDGRAGLHPCLVSFLAPQSFASEQYRVLRSLIERLKEEKGNAYVIAVTSPSVGDGKTTTAINLAGAFAQKPDARVLLVDADLCCSAILERLGEGSTIGKGLVEALKSSRVRLESIMVQYPQLHLTVLPVGRTTAPYDALSSRRFGSLLNEARHKYNYIILDMPPVISIPDYQLIENCIDGVFLVVSAHKTPRDLVQEALSVMSEEKILGLVFNGGEAAFMNGEEEAEHLRERLL